MNSMCNKHTCHFVKPGIIAQGLKAHLSAGMLNRFILKPFAFLAVVIIALRQDVL